MTQPKDVREALERAKVMENDDCVHLIVAFVKEAERRLGLAESAKGTKHEDPVNSNIIRTVFVPILREAGLLK